MKTATDVGLQTWEADVTCGVWCQGGSVRWLKTDHPQYTDASDVWVRGDDAIAALESLRAELAACREDAERYRWLREHWDDVNHPVDFIICNSFVTTLDADVDAARKGEVET